VKRERHNGITRWIVFHRLVIDSYVNFTVTNSASAAVETVMSTAPGRRPCGIVIPAFGLTVTAVLPTPPETWAVVIVTGALSSVPVFSMVSVNVVSSVVPDDQRREGSLQRPYPSSASS